MDIEKIRKEKPIQELLNFSILNIDKPTGPTSFSVSDYIRHALNLSKTSHFGTLDPMVTGVLPVGLGRACRLSDYFMHRDKVYVGIMRMHKEINEKELRAEIEKFIGKINQLPPVRSRVKREVREREVKSFEIIEIDGNDVLFSSQVQAGTYIRKLCDDIGKNLGGAHMLELRRIEAGIFHEPCYTLYDLDKAIADLKAGNEKTIREMLVPAEIVSTFYPVIELNKSSIKQIKTGKPLFKKDIIGKFDLQENEIFIGVCEDKFIGCYKVKNEEEIIARPGFIYN